MPTVFIVDDHQDTAEALAVFLESNGFTAEFYTDFKSAEDRIVRDHPGILLTDYYMFGSDISTQEFIDRIRAHFPRLKIVILSGDPLKNIDAGLMGADFLAKPIDLERLEKLCAEHCVQQ